MGQAVRRGSVAAVDSKMGNIESWVQQETSQRSLAAKERTQAQQPAVAPTTAAEHFYDIDRRLTDVEKLKRLQKRRTRTKSGLDLSAVILLSLHEVRALDGVEGDDGQVSPDLIVKRLSGRGRRQTPTPSGMKPRTPSPRMLPMMSPKTPPSNFAAGGKQQWSSVKKATGLGAVLRRPSVVNTVGAWLSSASKVPEGVESGVPWFVRAGIVEGRVYDHDTRGKATVISLGGKFDERIYVSYADAVENAKDNGSVTQREWSQFVAVEGATVVERVRWAKQRGRREYTFIQKEVENQNLEALQHMEEAWCVIVILPLRIPSSLPSPSSYPSLTPPPHRPGYYWTPGRPTHRELQRLKEAYDPIPLATLGRGRGFTDDTDGGSTISLQEVDALEFAMREKVFGYPLMCWSKRTGLTPSPFKRTYQRLCEILPAHRLTVALAKRMYNKARHERGHFEDHQVKTRNEISMTRNELAKKAVVKSMKKLNGKARNQRTLVALDLDATTDRGSCDLPQPWLRGGVEQFNVEKSVPVEELRNHHPLWWNTIHPPIQDQDEVVHAKKGRGTIHYVRGDDRTHVHWKKNFYDNGHVEYFDQKQWLESGKLLASRSRKKDAADRAHAVREEVLGLGLKIGARIRHSVNGVGVVAAIDPSAGRVYVNFDISGESHGYGRKSWPKLLVMSDAEMARMASVQKLKKTQSGGSDARESPQFGKLESIVTQRVPRAVLIKRLATNIHVHYSPMHAPPFEVYPVEMLRMVVGRMKTRSACRSSEFRRALRRALCGESGKIMEQCFWWIWCSEFQKRSKRAQGEIQRTISLLYVQLLAKLEDKGHFTLRPNAICDQRGEKDLFFQYFPFAVANAVTWAYYLLIPSMRGENRFDGAWKWRVYSDVHVLLTGVDAAPSTIRLFRERLFPDEDLRSKLERQDVGRRKACRRGPGAVPSALLFHQHDRPSTAAAATKKQRAKRAAKKPAAKKQAAMPMGWRAELASSASKSSADRPSTSPGRKLGGTRRRRRPGTTLNEQRVAVERMRTIASQRSTLMAEVQRDAFAMREVPGSMAQERHHRRQIKPALRGGPSPLLAKYLEPGQRKASIRRRSTSAGDWMSKGGQSRLLAPTKSSRRRRG